MPPYSKRCKRNNGPFTSDRVLDMKSPILTRDLHLFLVRCMNAWDRMYEEEERRRIIDTLPVAYRLYKTDKEGKLICPVSIEMMDGNQDIKSAASRFQENVKSGYYEKGWQRVARNAMQERAEGKCNTYLEDHSEKLFGAGPE